MFEAASDYRGLTVRQQVHRIRQVAVAALDEYDIDVVGLRLRWHDFNTTFRVDAADGRRFALRVNVHSRKDPANLDAELAWLAAIAADTDIAVPAPEPTRAGALRTTRRCASLGRDLPVVLLSWLPGRDLDDGSPESLRALGSVMARLHDHASSWSPPPGTWFPAHRSVLVDQPDRLGDPHPALDDADRAVLAAAFARSQQAHDRVSDAGPVHALHADLHGGNVKWWRRGIAVFDFDDAVMGTPVQDLAIATYYLRDDPTLEAALFEGYAAVRPLPAVDPDVFEGLVAGRNLILLNDLLAGLGAADRDIAPVYARNTVRKLRAFLDTGIYRHGVDGLEPLDL